jgi:hypothetical protein
MAYTLGIPRIETFPELGSAGCAACKRSGTSLGHLGAGNVVQLQSQIPGANMLAPAGVLPPFRFTNVPVRPTKPHNVPHGRPPLHAQFRGLGATAGFGIDGAGVRDVLQEVLGMLRILPTSLASAGISASDDRSDADGSLLFPDLVNTQAPMFDTKSGVVVWPANSFATFSTAWAKMVGTPTGATFGKNFPLSMRVSQAITTIQNALNVVDFTKISGVPDTSSTPIWPWIVGGVAVLLGGYLVVRHVRNT